MIKVEAIVREEKYEEVKEALARIHVNGMTVSQVMGCGLQHGYTEYVRGQEVEVNMLPKLNLKLLSAMKIGRIKQLKRFVRRLILEK